MSIRINYNPMSVLTHANLARTDRLMAGVLDRLSSGERLRRSADDPASMVVANAVRFQRVGVDRAQANAEEGVTMLQTAEGGMDQISQILQRVRTLVVAGLSDATGDPAQLAALQADIDAAIGSVTTVATSTTYGGNNLLDGSLRDTTLSDEAKELYRRLSPDWRMLPGGMRDAAAISIQPASGALAKPYTTQAFGAGTPGTAVATATAGTLALTGPNGSMTISIAAGASIDTVAAAINAAASVTGVAAAYDQATGLLKVESANYGASTLSVVSAGLGGLLGGAVVPAVNRTIDVTYVDGAGFSRTATLTQDPSSADGLTFTNLGGGPEAAPPYTAFAPGAFSLVVRDTSGGAVGSTVTPAAAAVAATRVGTTGFQLGALASQRVIVEIPDLRAAALGSGAGLAASGFASLESLRSRTGYAGALPAGDADEALRVIDAALVEVNRARGAAGALQGNTVERVKEALGVSSVNLREFESILRDVDMARESAEYARVQVMVQAATAMLAQANQVPQTVLQLLR